MSSSTSPYIAAGFHEFYELMEFIPYERLIKMYSRIKTINKDDFSNDPDEFEDDNRLEAFEGMGTSVEKILDSIVKDKSRKPLKQVIKDIQNADKSDNDS